MDFFWSVSVVNRGNYWRDGFLGLLSTLLLFPYSFSSFVSQDMAQVMTGMVWYLLWYYMNSGRKR